jgi:ribA/ribD-fused uncharacterized protein
MKTRSGLTLPESCDISEVNQPATNMADSNPGDILLEKVIKIEEKVAKLDKIEEKIDSVYFDINQMKDKQAKMEKEIESYETDIANLQRENSVMKLENITLMRQVSELKERQIKLECYERRSNLLFGNIAESSPENCENQVKHFITNLLGLNCENFKFERVHRLGANPIRGKTRPIIARFCYYKERQLVWQQRDKLRKTNSWIAEDFAEEVKERRQILKPVLRKAIEMKKTAFLSVDQLVIDKKPYNVNNLATLPQELNPAKLATVSINEKITAFSGAASPLSNFHQSPFEMNGLHFANNEQFYQYHKARINSDMDTARKILQENSPAKCKQLGDRVKVANPEKWNSDCLQMMYEGCRAKFTQNRALRQFLMTTGTTELVEGRNDAFWGAGKWMSDLKKDPMYAGTNHLGKILETVRRELSGGP